MDPNNNPYGQQPYIPTPLNYPMGQIRRCMAILISNVFRGRMCRLISRMFSKAVGFYLPSSLTNASTYYDYDYGDNRYSVFYMNDDEIWDVTDSYNSNSTVLFTTEPGTIYFPVDTTLSSTI